MLGAILFIAFFLWVTTIICKDDCMGGYDSLRTLTCQYCGTTEHVKVYNKYSKTGRDFYCFWDWEVGVWRNKYDPKQPNFMDDLLIMPVVKKEIFEKLKEIYPERAERVYGEFIRSLNYDIKLF